MTTRFTINRTERHDDPLTPSVNVAVSNSYSVDIDSATLFAKLYNFEDESLVEQERNNNPRKVLVKDNNGEPFILINSYRDLHQSGIVFWESLLNAEITTLDGSADDGETIFILHYAKEGGTLEPEDIDLQASHHFIIKRNASGLFDKINTELWPGTWFQNGCDMYIDGDEKPHKIYALIPHDSILVSKGIQYWHDMFKIHGGMKPV